MSEGTTEQAVQEQPCMICGEICLRETSICIECEEKVEKQNIEVMGTADNCKTCGKGESCEMETHVFHAVVATFNARISALEMELMRVKGGEDED